MKRILFSLSITVVIIIFVASTTIDFSVTLRRIYVKYLRPKVRFSLTLYDIFVSLMLLCEQRSVGPGFLCMDVLQAITKRKTTVAKILNSQVNSQVRPLQWWRTASRPSRLIVHKQAHLLSSFFLQSGLETVDSSCRYCADIVKINNKRICSWLQQFPLSFWLTSDYQTCSMD